MNRLTDAQREFAAANYGLVASARARFGKLFAAWQKRCRWFEQDDVLIPAYITAVATWVEGRIAFSTWFFWRVRDKISNWAKKVDRVPVAELGYAKLRPMFTEPPGEDREVAAERLKRLGLRPQELDLFVGSTREVAARRGVTTSYVSMKRHRIKLRLTVRGQGEP